MKNTISLQREFGEVTLKAALPSLEDFARKMSNNNVHNVLDHISGRGVRSFYNDDLTHVYNFDDFDSMMDDFHSVVEQKKLLIPRYNWGDVYLCNEEYLNVVPFFSRGISVEKTLKFKGIYSEESLKRTMLTLNHLIEYIKGFRKNISFSFEVEENDADQKPVQIRL